MMLRRGVVVHDESQSFRMKAKVSWSEGQEVSDENQREFKDENS
jgi:hypothetical protein